MVKNSKRKSSDDSGAIVSDNDSHVGSSNNNTKTTAPALRSVNEEVVETADNLQCEDPYEDIYEEEDDDISYEDVYESSGDEDDEYMEAMNEGDTSAAAAAAAAGAPTKETKLPPPINANDGELQPAQIKTWNPFMGNTTGEELEMDETAYKMHHALTPEWPSLTLDIVPDAHLGENRTRFPHTVTMVVGTQADKRSKNKLSVLRMSDLCRIPGSGREKTEKELDDEMLGDAWKHEDDDDDSDSSSSDEEDEEEELDPVLENYSFSHSGGGINRIRVCPHNSSVVGVWGENGEVSLYDIGGAIDLLDRSSLSSNARKNDGSQAMNKEVRKMRKDPFFVYSGHSTEGYAIDWSRVTPGRLATADCDGNIHIWNATHPVTPNDIVAKYGNKSQSSPWSNSSFQVEPMYAAHGDNLDNPSVEDLQWSPTEATVLASAECGGYVRIYDIRCPGKAMISNKIHSGGADVNVISWNKLVGNLLATGGDDGSFSVFDLRNFQTADASIPPKPLARFHSHRTPITSLEWHPTDESMIAVSDDNGTYVYDLSIEEDDPENNMNEDEAAVEGVIPPQLLFVHSGSQMTKEVHWHPQIPSCIATTSLSGYSVFIPSNL
jgi:ribosome assembly protein RRB1